MRLSSRETARIFAALSDVTRVEIVRLVAKAPRNVTQLTSLVGVSQPKVSRHLRILRDAGLLMDVRRGKWVWYELAEPSKGRAGRVAISAIDNLFPEVGSREEAVSPATEVSRGARVSLGASTAVPAASVGAALSAEASRLVRKRTSGAAGPRTKKLPRPAAKKDVRKRRGEAGTSRTARKTTTRPPSGKARKPAPAAPGTDPSRGAKRKRRVPRERTDSRRKELEDFLL